MPVSKDSVRPAAPGLAGLEKKYGDIATLGNRTRRLFLEFYALFQIATTLSEKMEMAETLRVLKKIIREVFPCQQFSLMLLDEARQGLQIRSHFGFSRRQAETALYALGEDVFGVALKKRRPIHVEDITTTRKHFAYHPGRTVASGAFVAVPLLAAGKQEIGVMSLYRRTPRSFPKDELVLLRKLAGQVAMAIERITQYQHHRELSMTDELTGIFNRRYFNQRFDREMQRAQRYGRPLSVIMIDIDHFKTFNDNHGHLLGDQILQGVAGLLESSIRKADILARFGGEEFVILLPEIDNERGRKVAEKLRRAVEHAEFPKADSQPLGRLTISLGLAAFPEDSRRAPDLLERADQSLYLAKTLGRNQVAVPQDANSDPGRLRRDIALATANKS